MKRIVLIVCMFAIASCSPTQQTVVPAVNNPPSIPAIDYPVEDVLDYIKKEYDKAIGILAGKGINNIEIDSAELSLVVSTNSGYAGGISVLGIEGSGSRAKSSSTTVTFTLTKPEVVQQLGQPERGGIVTLSDLIVAMAEKFDKIDPKIAKLQKESFEIEIVFSLKNEGGLKFSIELFKTGFEVGGMRDREVEHTMTLTFKPIKK